MFDFVVMGMMLFLKKNSNEQKGRALCIDMMVLDANGYSRDKILLDEMYNNKSLVDNLDNSILFKDIYNGKVLITGHKGPRLTTGYTILMDIQRYTDITILSRKNRTHF